MFESIKKWWDYDRNSQLDMNHCINEVTSYIDRYLIPFFERGNDCNKAYNEVCNFKFSYQPYKKTILMDDYNKYCMVLKVGKYDLAISHLKAIEQQWMDTYDFMEKEGNLTEEYIESTNVGLKEFREEISGLTNYKEEYAHEFIRKNEENSLQLLKKYVVF